MMYGVVLVDGACISVLNARILSGKVIEPDVFVNQAKSRGKRNAVFALIVYFLHLTTFVQHNSADKTFHRPRE